VHGTGASTHSFADLMDRLVDRFAVVTFDLPGHAFSMSSPAGRSTLPRMADLVAGLLETLDVRPVLAVGHSAGAAIIVRMVLDGRIEPKVVLSLNGALSGFQGASRIFSPLAKLLALNPLAPRLFAWRAQDAAVLDRLIRKTGSRLDARAGSYYARLARDPEHVSAALAMMAGWDLEPLWRDLRSLSVPTVLVAGARDGMVPAEQVFEVAKRIPSAEVVILRRHGHLAHEEDPAAVAEIILETAIRHGIIVGGQP